MGVSNGSKRLTLSSSTFPRRADVAIIPETRCGDGASLQDCSLSELARHLSNSSNSLKGPIPEGCCGSYVGLLTSPCPGR